MLVRTAKINLSLLTAGLRSDGFHQLETIMAKINYYDEILLQRGRKSGIELICDGPCWAPTGSDNLVYQACKMIFDRCSFSADVKITLAKNIPAGSGLGSASSDAAAVLMALNSFFNLDMAAEELNELASGLGSDVAFFLNGPLAFCTGRGEKIRELDKKFDFLALLILPNITVSTKRVYANYKHNQAVYKRLSPVINGYIEKNRVDLASKMCTNMLATSCFDLYPELAMLKSRIESLGIRPLCLSGSGSSMFCIIDDGDMTRAKNYKRKVEETIGCRNIIVSNNRW